MDNDADRSDRLEHGYPQGYGYAYADEDPASAESRSRSAYRWRRRATVAASAVAFAAVLVGGVLLSRGPAKGSVGLPVGNTVTGTASTSPPTVPVVSASAPTADTSPSETTEPSTPPSPYPTAGQSQGSMPADLHVTGPTEVILTPSGGQYRGTLTLTVTNTGPTPYGMTSYTVTLPAGVSIDFTSTEPFGPCLFMGNEQTSVCGANPVPARGGKVTLQIELVANYAPQASGLTLTDFGLKAQARAATSDTAYQDPTPNDNQISVAIKLAPAT